MPNSPIPLPAPYLPVNDTSNNPSMDNPSDPYMDTSESPRAQVNIGEAKPSMAPQISLVGAAAFAMISKQKGTQQFTICVTPDSLKGRSATATPAEAPQDLSRLPKEYHKFADVFSKSKAKVLASH